MKDEAKSIEFDEIKKKVDYLLKREQIIRLINYLVHKLKYRSQTFYLACYLTDLFLMKFDDEISPELVAVTALVLTVKFDENDAIAPELSLFKNLSLNKIRFSCEIDDILHCEVVILKVLDYKLNFYTPYHFINFLFGNGIVFKDEILKSFNEENDEESTHDLTDYEKIYDIAKEALFLLIEEEDYLYFGSLEIACGCVAYARSNFLEVVWEKRLEKTYNIMFEDFSDCFDIIKSIFRRKKLQSNKQSATKNKMPSSSSNYITNLPSLNKPNIPKISNFNSIGKEETNYVRENSRKPGSRQKIIKYSLEPISRHKNMLESSREKKQIPQDNYDKFEKFLEHKSSYKLAKINLNSNIQTFADKNSKREDSVNKSKKPFSSNFHNINIVPYGKSEYTSEASHRQIDLKEELLISKTKKLLPTKDNFDRMQLESANTNKRQVKLEFPSKYNSNINVLNIANKINYNGNFNKNLNQNPPNSNFIEFNKNHDKSGNLNIPPKYVTSSKKRENSKSKEYINFNSNFSQKKQVNLIPPISSLNNSNEKVFSHQEQHFSYNNAHLPPKKLEYDMASKPASKLGEEPTIQIPHLKEMPIPSSNLYSGKNSYNRIQSGYRDLKSRQGEFGRKDENQFLSQQNN